MRTKKTFINYLTDAIPLLIISILGIYKSKIFLQVLGDETLGLYQLFSQIMIYIGLVDGGLGSAILYYLYKPNSVGDDKKMAAILSGARRVFSLIGIVVFIIAFIVSFFVPYMIKGNGFSNNYISLTFILFAISNIISYFFVPYKSLLEVKEKKYVTNLSIEIGKVVQSILEIILLINGVKFEIILIMHSVIALISNIIIVIVTRRMYKNFNFKEQKYDLSFTKEIKNLVVHKVNGLISVNIDIILITIMLGLPAVAIYSSYNVIINMLRNFIYKLSGSITAIVGNFMINEKDRMYSLFTEIISLLYYVATIICVPLFFAINEFISKFYDGKIETSMLMAIACVSFLFIEIIRLAINIFANAGGLFKKTKICTYFDMSINLILSLILIKCIGIPGVILATTVALVIADLIIKSRVVHKEIFNASIGLYIKKNIKLLLIAMIDFILAYVILRNLTFKSISDWFITFTVFTIANMVIISIIYYLLKEFKFIKRITYLKAKED